MGRTGQQMRRRTAQAIERGQTGSKRAPGTLGRGAKLRYRFDNSMSRGTPALVAWLALLTLVLILVFGLITSLFHLRGSHQQGFFRQVFFSLMHALDPGAIGGDSGTWRFLFTMLVLTIAGLFIVSALIGVIAAGIDTKLADLRRGRSAVIEKDHTVILGWSEAVFTIVRELSIANESRRKPVIVVLADRDKVEMEDELREKLGDLRGTRVVVRSGSPIDIGDLALSSPHAARSVIVLAPDSEDPDSEVIKALLALTHTGEDGPPIVAEIQDPQNLEAARMVGGGRTVIVDKRETVARLIVQTSRQSGAAAVYTELFDFDGDEIYFHVDPALAGSTYADAQLAYEQASVIGLLDADGRATLNPPPSTPIGTRTLIVVAEDDSALAGQQKVGAEPDDSVFSTITAPGEGPSTSLLIGWNERAVVIVRELDNYAEPGSSLVVLTEFGTPQLPTLVNLTATVIQGRTTDRATLTQHVTTDLNQIIVLCYSDDFGVQQADARTLVTLLHVREIIGDVVEAPAVVSEMLDDRNRTLAEVAHVDDVIVSDEILSLMLTQLSEDPRLEPVFADLLDADGAEIYLRPAEWYVEPGNEVSFATIVAGATRRGETAFGYRTAALARDAGNGFGVQVNPAKSELFTITPGDRVVVLAED
ncbi:MAG: TrkA-N domain protein [Marmoricola sp.]|nr:TrkA-N domain protein [Marmoricola sp.]